MIITLIVALTGVCLLAVASFASFRRLKKLKIELANQQKQTELAMNEIKSLLSADILFGKSLAELNQQIISIDNKIEHIDNQRHNDGGYQHALKILEMGGDKLEIMESCHLSNAEAELLINLHAYRSATKV